MRTGAFRVFLSVLLLPVISAPRLAAQSTDVSFEHLTVDQGLSFNEVTAIMQDSRGFMWFGTGNGLNRYDGYGFTTYRTEVLDSNSLSSNWVSALCEDHHGNIWILAPDALNRLDRVTGRVTRHLTGMHVTSMCEDSSANSDLDCMWFTTLGRGVYRYNKNNKGFTAYRHNPEGSGSISSDSAFCAFLDGAKTLWVGTTNGLHSLNRSRQLLTHHASGPKHRVYTVYEDPRELNPLLWIGTSDGLYSYDRSGDTFTSYRNDLGNPTVPGDNIVRTINGDSKGRLWVGMKRGIAMFDRSTRRFASYQGGLYGNTWEYVNKAWSICEDRTGTMWMVSHWDPLRRYDEVTRQWAPVRVASDHEVTFHALCEDRCGTMWFGTVADAVLKLDMAKKPFSLSTHIAGDSSSLNSATVTGICEDASGTLWVGTDLGLNKLNATTGRFTRYEHDERNPQSLSGGKILAILEDRRGRLWIGTDGGGLDEFDRGKRRFIHHRFDARDSMSLTSDRVYSLCEGRDGTLWIGTAPNVTAYLPASNTFQRHYPGYPKSGFASEVRAILEDHTGLIWTAVPGAGVSSYDRSSGTWTQFVRDPNAGNRTKSIGDMGVRSLCEDRRGTLWVGTDGGLFRFERETGSFTPFTVKDGLKNDYVDAILEDDRGLLWLCTAQGISRFDPQNGSFRNFDSGDGVAIGTSRLPTGHKNKKGEMFFGGSNGMVRFHPDSIKDNPFVPPVVISAFKKFDRPVSLDTAISEKKLITLSYAENVFSFEFAALNFTNAGKNQYAYKLEGFDHEWTYCGTRRYAIYTNLDGGSYVFRVKGSNNDGVWNEEGASITVVITPPFWKRWWFTALFWVTVAVAFGGTIRYLEKGKLKRRIERLEQQQALEQERLRISRDMHDEVGATLTQISILSELAGKDGGESGDPAVHVKRISEKSREVIDNIGEIIWAINPKNDQLENLVAYLRQYALQYFSSSRIANHFEAPDDLPALSMSAQARRNIFLVCKESMHNVMKHSEATEFTLTLRQSQGRLEIHMKDDGKGFSADNLSGLGYGVSNMKRRMGEIGGSLTIDSRPGQGTCVALTAPSGEKRIPHLGD